MRLTSANTAIVLDSTADLPDAADRFASWRVVPLYVRFGDESLRDGVDIDAAEFYERLRAESVFPTTSHPNGPVAGVKLIEDIARAVNIPVLAIGGINATNARSCIDAGAAGVAVISAIFDAEDPKQAAQELWRAIA